MIKKMAIIGIVCIIFLLYMLEMMVGYVAGESAMSFFVEQENGKSYYEEFLTPTFEAVMDFDQVYIPPSWLLGIIYSMNKEPSKKEVMDLAQKTYGCVINEYEMVEEKVQEKVINEDGSVSIITTVVQRKELVEVLPDKPTKLTWDSYQNAFTGELWQPNHHDGRTQERFCTLKDEESWAETIEFELLKDFTPVHEKQNYLLNIYSQIGYYSELDREVANNWNQIKDILGRIEDEDYEQINPNSTWIRPIEGGRISAGTWHYGDGWTGTNEGIHLGLDFADSIGTEVRAAGNGIVLVSYDGCPAGYLGNMCGAGGTAGGGNQLILLMNVDGTTYAVKYLHFLLGTVIATGTIVEAGQKIGELGMSGNVTGPHVHVEVTKLGAMSLQDYIQSWNGDLSFGCGWGLTGLKNICSMKEEPCRDRPEYYFD